MPEAAAVVAQDAQRRRRRDLNRIRRKVRTNRHIHRLLRFIARGIVNRLFRVRTENIEIVHRQSGPYLLLANHSSVMDPFLVGAQLNRPLHFVASDSQFRNKLVGWLLQLAGTIPKTKALSDLDTVKKIVEIRRMGGAIGVFPEGQSTWDGHSLPLVPATTKLVKSLKVPVFVAQIRGAYFSWPRWGRGIRRGRIVVRYDQLFDPQTLKSASLEEVRRRLTDAMTFNAFDEQEHSPVRFRSARRAEYLERVLFACPSCRSLHTLESRRSRLTCRSCGYRVVFGRDGRFASRRGRVYFDTIRSWNLWQRSLLFHVLDAAGSNANGRDVIFTERVSVGEGFKTLPLEKLGDGEVRLYGDSLEIAVPGGGELTFALRELEGVNVQNNEHLEFYARDRLYRLSPLEPRVNTYKWWLAIDYLRSAGT